MKISREINGQMVELELTFSELMAAHDEYSLDCAIADVNDVYEQRLERDLELSDEQLKSIAEQALHNLSKNDSYYDAYWESFKYTFKDCIEELLNNNDIMKIRIYQINTDRDANRVVFESFDNMKCFSGNGEVDTTIYDKVFDGSVACGSLEGVYEMFNVKHPVGYAGRSLSMSDVIEVVEAPKIVGKIVYHNTGCESVFTDFLKYTQKIEELREMDVDFTAHDYAGLEVSTVEKGFYYCDRVGFKKISFLNEKSLDDVISECSEKQTKQAETKDAKTHDVDIER